MRKIFVVVVSLVAGAAIGAIAGFAGGWIDELVMRAVDVLLAFPGILLAIALGVGLAIGLGWVYSAGQKKNAELAALREESQQLHLNPHRVWIETFSGIVLHS